MFDYLEEKLGKLDAWIGELKKNSEIRQEIAKMFLQESDFFQPAYMESLLMKWQLQTQEIKILNQDKSLQANLAVDQQEALLEFLEQDFSLANLLNRDRLLEATNNALWSPEQVAIVDRQEIHINQFGITRLTRSMMEFLKRYQALYTLELKENNLVTLPDTIGELTTLRELYLDKNQIVVLPRFLAEIPLEVLVLSCNRLTEVPKVIYDLKHLWQLSLDDNELKFVDSNISDLKILCELNLSENYLSEGQIEMIEQLPFLLQVTLTVDDQQEPFENITSDFSSGPGDESDCRPQPMLSMKKSYEEHEEALVDLPADEQEMVEKNKHPEGDNCIIS